MFLENDLRLRRFQLFGKRGLRLKRVIIIMGTPSVGKTAVSDLLAKKLDAMHIDLGKLVVDEKLSSGVDEERGSLIVDKKRLAKRVRQVIDANVMEHDVIVDGHYATDIVDSEVVTLVFVLRRHPKELKQLMAKRGFKGRKIWENLAAEILDVCLYDAIKVVGTEKVCEIDATHKNSREIACRVIDVLDGREMCTSGNIDWIGKLEQEGILDKYLREF